MSNTVNRIKALRLERAWSQETLAEISGLSSRTIQRIESGDQPSLETMSALAAAFEVTVSELYEEEIKATIAIDHRIEEARQRIAYEMKFFRKLIIFVVTCLCLMILNYFTFTGNYWSLWVVGIWGMVLIVRAMNIFVFYQFFNKWKQKRLNKMLRM